MRTLLRGAWHRQRSGALLFLVPLCLLAARMAAEAWPTPLPVAGIAALMIAAVALAVILSAFYFPLFSAWWPLLLLFIYILWPWRDVCLAIGVGLLAMLTALLGCHPQPAARWIKWVILGSSLSLYLLTLQKDILPADSGEFQLVATQLGVAHPPGYPLYTLVGKLFTLLTPWRPALGLNLMSAVLAAATLTLTFMAVQRTTAGAGGAWGGVAAALALGASTTFWAQATTANIRMPTVFFMAWCLYELARFDPADRPASSSALARFGLALSLGLAHHASLIFTGLVFILYLILADPPLLWTPRRWLEPLGAFALGQVVWLYLPIRGAMGALFAPDDLTLVQGFLYHVLARGFSGDMFAFADPPHLSARLAVLPTLLLFQFNPILLVASAVGALITCWRHWRLGVMLIVGWALHVYVTMSYRAPQTVEYMMPAYVLQVTALGSGVAYLMAWAVRRPFLVAACSRLLVGGVLMGGLFNGAAHAPGYVQLAGDHSTRDYVAPILEQAPPGALILADWHWATPLHYLQIVEGLRPDVTVEYVYPVSNVDYSVRWLQRIEHEIGRRPVIVTHFFGVEFAASPYTFQPLGRAFWVLERPPSRMPAAFTPVQVEFENRINIIGYHLDRAAFHAGQAFELSLAWQPARALDRDYSFAVHIFDKDQKHIAQQDRLLSSRAAPGQVHIEQFVLPLPPDLWPGQYEIALGAYYSLPEGGWRNLTAQGQSLAPLTIISVRPLSTPLLTLHPLDVPFASGVRLTGVDYDRSDPNTWRVYLHWYQSATLAPAPASIYLRAGNLLDEQAMPDLPAGALFTTVHDLDAASAGSVICLELRHQSGAPIEYAGPWGLAQRRVELALPTLPARYVPLDDQIILTGVSSSPARLGPGEELYLALAFVARRSLVSDNSMSVRLVHTGGEWWLPQDTKPALDTARTLKWITGSRIVDPHRFSVPADAAPGRVEAHLTVYDEFRQTILPPLDARMGNSILLGAWEVGP